VSSVPASQTQAWHAEAARLLESWDPVPLDAIMAESYARARRAHGDIVTYSPKVFIPLTRLCRDVCQYCTFSRVPRPGVRAFLTAVEVRAIAAAGRAAGCAEALFTFGEAPEQRYRTAREELAELGFASTNAYCATMAEMVQHEFGLIAHINAGVMDADDLAAFRRVSGSQGLMLESVSDRLCERGQVHHGCASKRPAARLAMIEAAGRLAIPFTTGILIGIGETAVERVASLLAIRDLHRRYGHIQEVIVQNFLPKPNTNAADRPAASFEDLLRTVAMARMVLPDEMHVQAPPNLSFDRFGELLQAGLDDWGGISPVTPDHINPEAPWPQIGTLRRATEAAGLELVARTPVYPQWAAQADRWLASESRPMILRASDAEGLLRTDPWSPGVAADPVRQPPSILPASAETDAILAACLRAEKPGDDQIVTLLTARGGNMETVLSAADEARRVQAGNTVTYVVNRNINYTNICAYKCGFCAFSKGKTHEYLRGAPYDLSLEEIARRTAEAWERGATEVCMQGGIHPRFTGRDYLAILRAVKEAVPQMHVHAFSPLEVKHGAQTLGIPASDFLAMLRDAGLGSLPGTAAEILSDPVRAMICPDKLTTAEWLEIVETAHRQGLKTTSTIMFGHVEAPADVAQHLLALHRLQARTGGITEFVPLPFVHAEAPMALKGLTRRGPTLRETLLVHAVARLVLGPLIPNIQASWVKLGVAGVAHALRAGVNDLGGVLMNESISRAAGADHGQELSPVQIEAIAAEQGRSARQRTTLYGVPDAGQQARSYAAQPLSPLILTAPRARSLEGIV